MTNEEFEGHLLAALHGPNAVKIADRLVEVVAESAGTNGVGLLDALKSYTNTTNAAMVGTIYAAAVLCLDRVRKGERPADAMDRIVLKAAASDGLRLWLCQQADKMEATDIDDDSFVSFLREAAK